MWSRRRQWLAVELVLVAVVVYLAAVGVSAAVRVAVDDGVVPTPIDEAPARPVQPLAQYAAITERDLFNAGQARRSDPTDTGTALKLWGIALHGDQARAVIEETATHHQDLYAVGDEIAGAQITAIEWDRVTLLGARGEETLEIAPPATAPSASSEPSTPTRSDDRVRRTADNTFIVDRRELEGAVDNMSGLLTQLRATAEVQDGKAIGFRLFQMKDDSLFARLGLKNGDVVQRVNGAAASDPATLLAFLKKLHAEPRVALDIVRGGSPRTLVYELR